MDVITVNVGQGAFVIVRNNDEAMIVDSCIPPAGNETVAYVKGLLATFLKDYNVRGLILTGFDSDHSNATGVALVLKKYRPDWVMYPKYYKDTEAAQKVFRVIADEEKERANTNQPLKRMSVRLDKTNQRALNGLVNNFYMELFSPHPEDMSSSNNSSIVLKVIGNGRSGFSYLITGDTESDRWDTISRLFGANLRSDVMAAPHHGSKSGAHAQALLDIQPNTVLISAGVDNQYGHPDSQAVAAYNRVAKHVFATNVNGGVSLWTSPNGADFQTKLIK
jgi:competence protein ComEC